MSSVLFIISNYMCSFEQIKISIWLHGTCFKYLSWRKWIHVKGFTFSWRGLSRFNSICSVLMNAGFLVASCDNKFIERQFDLKHVAACSVDPIHTTKRVKARALNSLIKRLVDLWEPGSNLALHLHCVCACHAQWAFSHPLQAAVALAEPTSVLLHPHMLCMVHISTPPTYPNPGIHRPACLSWPELSTAIG